MEREIKEKEPEVLLARDARKPDKLEAVTGLDDNGEPKTVPPTPENEPAFLDINKHDDFLESFFKNLVRQTDDPTHFGVLSKIDFYKVPIKFLKESLVVLKEAFKDEDGNSILLSKHRVNPEDYKKEEQTQNQTEQQKEDKAKNIEAGLDKYNIDWELNDKAKVLETLQNGQKTPLLTLKFEINGETFESLARFSLAKTETGEQVMSHPFQSAPTLDKEFFGFKPNEEDKEQLLKTGRIDRVIELDLPEKGKTEVLLGLDAITNRLEYVPISEITLGNQVLGAPLTPEKQELLLQGKSVLMEGMTSKIYGTMFDAHISLDPVNRKYTFDFSGIDRNRYKKQENNQSIEESKGETRQRKFRTPRTLKDVPLTDEQYTKLDNRETILVKGMKDKKGGTFDAYVCINDEKGKLDFYRWNPEKAQSNARQITPTSESRTQVAVNNGGTDERLRNIQEPIKQGQSQPTESQKNQQEERKQIQKKPSGMKI